MYNRYNPYNFYVRSSDPVNTEEGLLHIQVFENDRGRPIDGAEVKITPRGDYSQVLDDEKTDESGRTRNC